jgi:hypothetical protein
MKTNIYILSMLSLIFMISCKDDDPVTTDPTDPTDPVVVQGCTDATASNYNADATEDDGSCITDSGVFYQLPNLNSGAITFEEVEGIVYGPSALEDGSFDPEYEFDEDNTGGHWGVFGEIEDANGVVTGENPTMAYVANPDTTGNDSSTIVELVKKANSQKWSGIYFDFEENLVFPADKQALKIDFWSPEAGLEVRIKVETALLQSDENFATTGEITSNVINGVVAGWNTLTFNMPEGDTEGYNRLVIIPSIKVNVTEDVKYYFDNIDYSAPGSPEPVNVTLDLAFDGAFGAATFDATTSTYTFPSAAESWAGFSNTNDSMYPLDFTDAGAIQFTGAAPNGPVDVRFRFEFNPHPDTEPSYNTVAVTVSGEAETTYTVLVPSQGANTFSSVIMYLDTRDVGVVVKDALVVKEYDLGLTLDGAFGAATFDATTSTYTFPSAAESWAGFSNTNDAIYPITLSSDMEIRFTGAAPNGDVDVRFRFEFNPHPDTEPSYNTAVVTVTGADEATYSIPVPSQGVNTFSSAIMYLDTRDVGVVVKDVGIHNATPAE